jgi:hypothetical protein
LKAPRNFARTCIPLSRRKECALEIFLKNLPRKCSVYDLPAIDAESFFEFSRRSGVKKRKIQPGGSERHRRIRSTSLNEFGEWASLLK